MRWHYQDSAQGPHNMLWGRGIRYMCHPAADAHDTITASTDSITAPRASSCAVCATSMPPTLTYFPPFPDRPGTLALMPMMKIPPRWFPNAQSRPQNTHMLCPSLHASWGPYTLMCQCLLPHYHHQCGFRVPTATLILPPPSPHLSYSTSPLIFNLFILVLCSFFNQF